MRQRRNKTKEIHFEIQQNAKDNFQIVFSYLGKGFGFINLFAALGLKIKIRFA